MLQGGLRAPSLEEGGLRPPSLEKGGLRTAWAPPEGRSMSSKGSWKSGRRKSGSSGGGAGLEVVEGGV